jgi:hypothetical protein
MSRLPFQLSAFSPQLSALVAALVFSALATNAHALLGNTLDEVTKQRGKPSGQPEKNKAVWLFEGNDGQLAYAVRFDAAGKSIAETLKPALIGRSLHRDIVMDFIRAQTAGVAGSPTLIEPKVGDKYVFAGQNLVVAENEFVRVDPANGVLVVWVRGSMPSVTAVTPGAFK